MTCLEMYISEHKGAPMSPRISFSNDFADSNSPQQQGRSTRESPVSTDFEFTVSDYSLQLSADELFFKGRILPLKDNRTQKASGAATTTTTTTLRDELLLGDDDEDDNGETGFSLKPPLKGGRRWNSFLGLRKSHIGSRKPETHKFDEPAGFIFPLEDPKLAKSTQGMFREEGTSSATDMKMQQKG